MRLVLDGGHVLDANPPGAWGRRPANRLVPVVIATLILVFAGLPVVLVAWWLVEPLRASRPLYDAAVEAREHPFVLRAIVTDDPSGGTHLAVGIRPDATEAQALQLWCGPLLALDAEVVAVYRDHRVGIETVWPPEADSCPDMPDE